MFFSDNDNHNSEYISTVIQYFLCFQIGKILNYLKENILCKGTSWKLLTVSNQYILRNYQRCLSV